MIGQHSADLLAEADSRDSRCMANRITPINGATLPIVQTREKTGIISSCTGLNSTIFVSIFHKTLFIEINLERKKQLV
jgi:hypothetical protein